MCFSHCCERGEQSLSSLPWEMPTSSWPQLWLRASSSNARWHILGPLAALWALSPASPPCFGSRRVPWGLPGIVPWGMLIQQLQRGKWNYRRRRSTGSCWGRGGCEGARGLIVVRELACPKERGWRKAGVHGRGSGIATGPQGVQGMG